MSSLQDAIFVSPPGGMKIIHTKTCDIVDQGDKFIRIYNIEEKNIIKKAFVSLGSYFGYPHPRPQVHSRLVRLD